MSFRKPSLRTRRTRRQTSPPDLPSSQGPSRSSSPPTEPIVHHHLVPPNARGRRPRQSQGQFVPGPRHILSVPGQDYVQHLSTTRGRPQKCLQQNQTPDDSNINPSPDPADSSHIPTSDFDFMTDILITDPPETEEMRQERLRLKKRRQWVRWTQEVIPSLLQPHLRLLHKSNSLCNVSRLSTYQCTCGGSSSRSLTVVCVFFESTCNKFFLEFRLTFFVELQVIRINACQCSPAARQLLSRGLFPCAPIAPTLAVDIKMLEFVRELFLRMPPNTTSWCETLEVFLGKQSYKLTTRVFL